MRKIIALAISFLILTSLAISAHAVGSVPEKVIRATESVVRILSKYSDGYATGTGFVIKSDKNETLIITNHHVVEDNPYSISVWVNDGELINAEILAATSQKDICILRLTQQISLKTVSLSQASAKQGDAVYAVGFPAAADILSDTEAHTSQDATITDGIVSARREVTTTQYGTPVEILQVSAAINSGNSGGPLFDLNGKVVGVNTYGIADAQGIFGAIDISEIHSFLDENGVSVKADSKAITLISIVAVTALLVIVCIVVFSKKKKVSQSMKKKKNSITLRSFLTAYPNGLGINDAVALLLPVALQLRDMHNNGQPHLQVSPDTIMVGTTAKLVAPTEAESDRYTSGFAAKEIYSGSGKGILSDIYSFCAVLYYASFGAVPVNALQRSTEDICTNENKTFAQIINKGMQPYPEDRFDTMQSIILKLSEYNVKPFVQKEAVIYPTNSSNKKIHFTQKDKIQIIVSTILSLIIIVYFGSYFAAKHFAKNGNYSTADKCLFASVVTKLHDKNFPTYVEAGSLMERRQYLKAKELYSTIPGFLDTDTLILEADYCHAAQLADANDFGAAMNKYRLLSASGYKDSTEKIQETSYRQGLYFFYEEQNYLKAYRHLSNSEFNHIENIHKIRSELKELLYEEAVALYHTGQRYDAKQRFTEGYKDSDNYLLLIKVQEAYYGFYDGFYDGIDELIDIFYFEDTAEILLSIESIAKEFLKGNWRSANGGKYFKMDNEKSITYNLPDFNYGDYYKIQDGKVIFYPKNNANKTKDIFTIEALTPNQIQVYCHKDGSTHILNRQ